MAQGTSQRAPILVAIPDEWRSLVCCFLEQKGFSVLSVSSWDDASAAIQSRQLSGIVVVSEWAMASEDGATAGLVEIVKGNIPTVTLVRKIQDYRWFDEVYSRPLHEYCTIPFGLEELWAFMQSSGIVVG